MRKPKPVLWRRIWSFFGGPKYPAPSDHLPWLEPEPKPEYPLTRPRKKPAKKRRAVKRQEAERYLENSQHMLNARVAELNATKLEEATKRLRDNSAWIRYGVHVASVPVGMTVEAAAHSVHTSSWSLPDVDAYLAKKKLNKDYVIQPGDYIEFHQCYPYSRKASIKQKKPNYYDELGSNEGIKRLTERQYCKACTDLYPKVGCKACLKMWLNEGYEAHLVGDSRVVMRRKL